MHLHVQLQPLLLIEDFSAVSETAKEPRPPYEVDLVLVWGIATLRLIADGWIASLFCLHFLLCYLRKSSLVSTAFPEDQALFRDLINLDFRLFWTHLITRARLYNRHLLTVVGLSFFERVLDRLGFPLLLCR